MWMYTLQIREQRRAREGVKRTNTNMVISIDIDADIHVRVACGTIKLVDQHKSTSWEAACTFNLIRLVRACKLNPRQPFLFRALMDLQHTCNIRNSVAGHQRFPQYAILDLSWGHLGGLRICLDVQHNPLEEMTYIKLICDSRGYVL